MPPVKRTACGLAAAALLAVLPTAAAGEQAPAEIANVNFETR